MQRFLVYGFLLAGVVAAHAQTAPVTPPPPGQSPIGRQPTGQPVQLPAQTNDPNAIPGVPPTFAPGVGAADSSALSSQRRAVRISGGVMAGNLVSRVDPVYPDAAKSAHMEGTVTLSALIGRDGRVENLSVLSGPAPLQAAAVNAVKQWTYKPYRLNGDPVEVVTTITVNFHLQDQSH